MDQENEDKIAQKHLDEYRNSKVAGYKEIIDAKDKKRKENIEYVKTPLTVKDLQQQYPALVEMLKRKASYIDKASQQKLANDNTKKSRAPQKISAKDYNLSIEQFLKKLGLDIGKEAIIDSSLSEQYYLNLIDGTLGEILDRTDAIQKNGGELPIDGGMVWKCTLQNKIKNLNKGNNAGI